MTKERKFLLIGGILLLLAGAVYRFYPSIPALHLDGNAVVFKERELSKYRKAVQEKKALEALLLSRERALARAESGLLSQKTPALASVEIQNMLNDIADQKGIDIKSMRVVEPKPLGQGEYVTVPLDVTVSGDIRQLKEMLFQIETSPKLLRFSIIRIRVPNIRAPENLYCTFTIEGFMKDRKNRETA